MEPENANSGNAQAQYHLGHLYLQAKGVAKDVDRAPQWYTKSAAKGDSGAQSTLGSIFAVGMDVPKDEKASLLLVYEGGHAG